MGGIAVNRAVAGQTGKRVFIARIQGVAFIDRAQQRTLIQHTEIAAIFRQYHTIKRIGRNKGFQKF